jgi:hypothetical protein
VIEEKPPSAVSRLGNSKSLTDREVELPLATLVSIGTNDGAVAATPIKILLPVLASNPIVTELVSPVPVEVTDLINKPVVLLPEVAEKLAPAAFQPQPVISLPQPQTLTGNSPKRALFGILLMLGLVMLLIYLGSDQEWVAIPGISTPAVPEKSPAQVVRDYYQALHQHDKETVIKSWNKPANQLDNVIKAMDKIESFKVGRIALVSDDGRGHAVVEVEVTGKRKNEKQQRWVGSILLEQVSSEWKIVSMKKLEKKP